MRKWCSLFLSIYLFLIMPHPIHAAGVNPESFSRDVAISAETAAVIDVHSGRILYGKQMDKRMRIASLTKVMTAIVAIESGKLEQQVEISKHAARQEGSSVYLKEGDTFKLKDLLYALMLRSGNDAAMAIAESVGGSVEGFANLMNKKTAELGMSGSHFVNPSGLDAPAHFSTAKDMAILTAYALKNPTFAEISRTTVKTIPWPGEEGGRKLYNKNKMLFRYPGADGVKTGYTELAGRTLISSATREGRQIAVVVLNDRNDWDDSVRLLDYGFNMYHNMVLTSRDQVVKTVPVEDGGAPIVQLVANTSCVYPLRSEEKDTIRYETKLPQVIHAPVAAGEKVGRMDVYLGSEKLVTVDLIARTSVEGKGIWWNIRKLFTAMVMGKM